MKAVACWLVLVAACGREPKAIESNDLADYLQTVIHEDDASRAREVASWKLDKETFEAIVVVPFRGEWEHYATRFDTVAPSLVAKLDHAGAIHVRRHFAGDPALTASQGRLRWALPPMYPSFVADLDGEHDSPERSLIDTVFVRDGSHWRVLAGLDEEVLARTAALDVTCADRLALAGPRGPCTDIGWVIADAALRGDRSRFDHACKLAVTQCR